MNLDKLKEAVGCEFETRYCVSSMEVRMEEREEGESTPVLTGYAAVFGQLSEDLGGFREQVAPGAFKEAITKDDVRALINHDPNLVLGRNISGTLTMQEDERGLRVDIVPPDTSYAKDLLISMRRKDVTQMSFAFTVKPGGQDWAKDDNGVWIRTVKSVRLFDVSPVTYPAYPQTSIAQRSLKSVMDAQPPEEVDPKHYELIRRQVQLLEVETSLQSQRARFCDKK